MYERTAAEKLLETSPESVDGDKRVIEMRRSFDRNDMTNRTEKTSCSLFLRTAKRRFFFLYPMRQTKRDVKRKKKSLT